MNCRRAAAVAALALALAGGPGQARAAACGAIAGSMAFGIYDPVQAGPTDTTATVTVSCIPGLGNPLTTPYTLTVAGTGAGNDPVRSISWLLNRLYFQVYTDPARTQVWGNGSSSGPGVSSSVTSIATGIIGLRVHTAYARMPARQAVPPGIYLGGLLVTIEY